MKLPYSRYQKVVLVSSLGTLIILQGCATVGQSMLLGAGVGGAAGSGIGFAAQQTAGSAAVGAGVGALVGAGISYFVHKDKEQKENALKSLIGKRKELPAEPPILKAPRARCYKVDEKITDDEYFGPQLRCRIEKPAVWGLQ